MGEEHAIMLDPMAPSSPSNGVSSNSHTNDAGGEKVTVSLNGYGTAHGIGSHEAGAPESHKFESQSVASEEETNRNLSKMKSESLDEEERAPELPEDLKQENNYELESSNPLAPAPDASQEESAAKSSHELEQEAVVQTYETGKPSQELEQEAAVQPQETAELSEELEQEPVIQTQETAEQHEEEALAELNLDNQEEEFQVPDVQGVVKRDEIPATSDEQQQTQEVASSQPGGEVVKQEVAHRSHILGSLSKLDENSARQLLKDYGWNVSQSTRMNGKTQWYYRSPPPKPVLVGSLTSAVAMWKRLVDEEHKRKGSGDDDLYPMVTAFLNNVKRPATKKRKRGRFTD